MPAVTKKLVIEQYASFNLTLTYKDAKGRPINLTGYTARMQIRVGFGGAVLKTLVSPTDITLSSTGVISVDMSDEATGLLTFTDPAVYDLVLTPPSGKAIRLLQGTVTLSQGVTTPT